MTQIDRRPRIRSLQTMDRTLNHERVLRERLQQLRNLYHKTIVGKTQLNNILQNENIKDKLEGITDNNLKKRLENLLLLEQALYILTQATTSNDNKKLVLNRVEQIIKFFTNKYQHINYQYNNGRTMNTTPTRTLTRQPVGTFLNRITHVNNVAGFNENNHTYIKEILDNINQIRKEN